MFRSPVPNTDRMLLEHCRPEQLLGLFEYCLRTKSRKGMCSELPDAWGTLFSNLYLSADEIVDEMLAGRQRLEESRLQMLREFIKADCAGGGVFVLDVIRKGGMIDRAALIMIADLRDLANIEYNGVTAIHLLADACDREMRPVLIIKAGRKLLSSVYDGRGLPVLLSIFGLSDLGRDDLEAITKIFSKEDLRRVTNRNRIGKNALEIYTEVYARLKDHPPSERNKLVVSFAIRSTNMEGDLRSRIGSHSRHEGMPGTQVQAAEGNKTDADKKDATSIAERYEEMMGNPLDDISKMMRKARRIR